MNAPSHALSHASSRNKRRSIRFPSYAPVEVMRGAERHSHGLLINLARDGAAFRAYAPLDIGETYEFHIRGVGRMPGTVVRRFDGERYGVRFDIDEEGRRRIDVVLTAVMKMSLAARTQA